MGVAEKAGSVRAASAKAGTAKAASAKAASAKAGTVRAGFAVAVAAVGVADRTKAAHRLQLLLLPLSRTKNYHVLQRCR